MSNQGDAAASAGLKVAFYRGNPASGGTLLGVAHVEARARRGRRGLGHPASRLGLRGARTVFAVADDDGTGQGRELECREDNNAGSASVSLACPPPEGAAASRSG